MITKDDKTIKALSFSAELQVTSYMHCTQVCYVGVSTEKSSHKQNTCSRWDQTALQNWL